MKTLNKLKVTAALLASLVLLGCSDDDDDDKDVVTGPNLTISEIDVNNVNSYSQGDDITIDFALVVQELERPDVDIDFYLSTSGSVADGIMLDSVALSGVENGTFTASFTSRLPQISEGTYWVVAVVDPDNEIEEANEDDNQPTFSSPQVVSNSVPAVAIAVEDSAASGVTGANLTITGIDANNLNFYELGDTISVDYELVVQELSQPDVTIEFYLVHTEADDATSTDAEISETHLLESVTLSAVENGHHIETFSADIPAVTLTGNYWIVAVVDPQNEVVEAEENDNYPNLDNAQHVSGDFPSIIIDIERSPEHEFVFVSKYIDGGLVVLDSPAVHEGTGEHHSDIIGHLDAIYYGDAEATAVLTAEVLIDGTFQAAQLWDAISHTYVASQSIDFEYNGAEHFFGFDVGLTDEQLAALYASYDATAASNDITIKMTLTDATDIGSESNDDNNSIELTVPLYFFEQEEEETAEASSKPYSPTAMKNPLYGPEAKDVTFTGNKLKVDGSYNKSYGDASKFKVGVDLGGDLQVDLLEKAASLEAGGSVDMWLFNAKNTIFGVSFDGQAYITGLNTGYDSEMIIFNATVFEDSYWNAQFEKTFEKSWEEERILAQARFSVGPIPITIKAGIDGGVGFELTIGYALSELYANGDIFSTNFGGFATGGVDLLLVEAGVVIDINILDNVLALETSAELALLDEGSVDPRVDYSFELTDDLDVISGRFGLYAEVTSVKWCKKWGVPYPCGSKETTYYLWFYQTPSVYKKSWTIFSKEGSISL